MAPGDVCKHDRLARSCDECFMEKELAAATEQIATLTARVEESSTAHDRACELMGKYYDERDTARRERDAMRETIRKLEALIVPQALAAIDGGTVRDGE